MSNVVKRMSMCRPSDRATRKTSVPSPTPLSILAAQASAFRSSWPSC